MKTAKQILHDAIEQYFNGEISDIELIWFISSRLFYISANIPDPYLNS